MPKKLQDDGQSSSEQESKEIEALKNLFYFWIERVGVKPNEVVKEARARGFKIEGDTLEEQIESLRHNDVKQLDKLAARYINTTTLLSGIQGFFTSLPGVIALPATLPAETIGTISLVARCFTGIMLSYGYYFDTSSEEGRELLLVELAAANGLNSISISGKEILIRGLSKKIMATPYKHMLLLKALKRLCKVFGVQLTKKVFVTKLVPIVGGVFGSGVNIATIQLLGRTTRRHFHRLLQEDLDRTSNEVAFQEIIDTTLSNAENHSL